MVIHMNETDAIEDVEPKQEPGVADKPPVNWVGGKVQMADYIINHMPEHKRYVELFGGSGAVLFKKAKSEVDIYNDMHGGITNLYRVLRDKDKTEDLIRQIELTPYSREEFYDCRDNWEKCDDGIEKARKFLAVGIMSFSGSAASPQPSWSFSYNDNSPIKQFVNVESRLLSCHKRLKNVLIESKDGLEMILTEDVDQPDTLLYVDPPYVKTTRSESTKYKYDFEDRQQNILINRLKKFSGYVVLSGYDNRKYNRMLEGEGWTKKEWETLTSGMRQEISKEEKERVEILWMNYDMDTEQVFEGVAQSDITSFFE